MIRTGLDQLLRDPRALADRRYGLLSHAAAVSADLIPIHLALIEAGYSPQVLLAPEHGFYGVEQDMVPAEETRDPASGLPVISLYGDAEATLRPTPEAFAGLDLLLIDLQDVGARYYTYAATAVWAAEVAAADGLEVWVLDRPNPLGGVEVEGAVRQEGYESFVGAFALPVRHGLTLGELMGLEASRRGFAEAIQVWEMEGWRRSMLWPETGRPWLSPSPNLSSFTATALYPGACLLEATQFSEGRGTPRPFELIGAPEIDGGALAERLNDAVLPGVDWLPTRFRPQFQKHTGEICDGVQAVVTDAEALRPFRLGVELLRALHGVARDAFGWREEPYEFVSDRPAVDLLSGGPDLRRALDAGEGLDDWIATWAEDEAAFREARRPFLLHPEEGSG